MEIIFGDEVGSTNDETSSSDGDVSDGDVSDGDVVAGDASDVKYTWKAQVARQ